MFFRNILLCSFLGVAYLLILYVTELRLRLTLTKCFNGHLRHVSWMIHTMSYTPRSLNDSRYVIYATFPEWFTLMVMYATFPEWFTLCHLRHVSWMIYAMVIYATFPEWFTLCHLHHVPWMIHAMSSTRRSPEWFTLWSCTPRSLNDSHYVIYATFPEWFTLWSSTPRSLNA